MALALAQSKESVFIYISLLNDKDYMMMKEKPYFLCYFI